MSRINAHQHWLCSPIRHRTKLDRSKPLRHGMALLVVMVLTMLIALGAYRYSFTMQAQYRLTRMHEEQVQARLAALSGLELAADVLSGSVALRESQGGVEDNAAFFQHVLIGPQIESNNTQETIPQWRVSLLSPLAPTDDSANGSAALGSGGNSRLTQSGENGPSAFRFGLENESAKLHIPTLLKWDQQFPGHARAALMRLPEAEPAEIDAWLRKLKGGMNSGSGVVNQNAQAGTFDFSGVDATAGSTLSQRLSDAPSTNDQQRSQQWLRQRWYGGDFNQNYRLDPLELKLKAALLEDGSNSLGRTGDIGNSTAASSGGVVGGQSCQLARLATLPNLAFRRAQRDFFWGTARRSQ